jgi:tripartite-type tricarboxylate transporter receptor subunit TctC
MKIFKIVSILLLSIATASVAAWEPTKPITVLIGNKPGSGNELGFRALSAVVNKSKPDVTFIVELRPGGEGTVAMNALYAAKPDGYTVSIPSYMGTFVTNDIWEKDLKKFQYNSFTNVMGMGKSPLTIVANYKSKINTVAELVNLVRTTNSPINFAIGGGAHKMTYEYFMMQADGNKQLVKSVSFLGPLQAVTAVASDTSIEFGIMPISIALPLVQSGKVKVIGITGERRLANLPNAEPIKVNGHYIDVFAAWAMVLPPNTPPEIVQWYLDTFIPTLRSPEVKRYYDDNLIFVEEKDLSPIGFLKSIEQLRGVWIPLSQKINLTQ